MTRYTDLASYSTSLQFKDGVDIILICEGESDKRILDRILNESRISGKCTSMEVSVESIQGMVKDKSGLGNKDCVIRCIDIIPHKTSTIYGLIDREFNKFDIKMTKDNFRKYKYSEEIYFTRGHSIENYFFEKGIIKRAILDVYSGRIDYKYISEASNYIEEAMRWGLCLSLYFYHRSLLAKTKEGFFDLNCWIFDESINQLTPNFAEIRKKLTSRGVSETVCDRLEIYSRLKYMSISSANYSTVKWMTHGHIGYSSLFSAFGSIIFALSGDRNKGTDLANGSNELKSRVLASNWLRFVGSFSKTHPLLKKVIDLAS